MPTGCFRSVLFCPRFLEDERAYTVICQGSDFVSSNALGLIPALECHDLWKTFRNVRREGWNRVVSQTKAVQGINLILPRNQILGVLGPNGSGKSTLIRMMATLLIPDQGSIEIFGMDVMKNRMAVRRLINRVSVEASFFKKLTARENLAYAAGLYGIPNRAAQQEATRILERLSLPRAKLVIPLENLSRGQQQKIAIARALLTSPNLMLLDEPTTGLDPTSRREVQDFILQVRADHDATILISTHDMVEAERLCDQIAIIHLGKFVANAAPADLISQWGEGQGLEYAFFRLTGRDLLSDEEPS